MNGLLTADREHAAGKFAPAGCLVGCYEPRMRAWDCMAGFCLVKEAGGQVMPFSLEGENLFEGQLVRAGNTWFYQDLVEVHKSGLAACRCFSLKVPFGLSKSSGR